VGRARILQILVITFEPVSGTNWAVGVHARVGLAVRLTALSAVSVLILFAQNGSMQHRPTNASGDTAKKPVALSGRIIPDVVLLNQRGQKIHFYSDLIKGKIVAINTVFTTCTTICPLMGANFARLPNTLRKMYGDEDNRKVILISISIDPVVDTPERLDQWSCGFGEIKPSWTLLTGPKTDIDSVLKALQMFAAVKLDHAPVVLIGADGGDWSRVSALLPPARLASFVHARLELMQPLRAPNL
jgi:protein SCO1/2